MSEFLGREEVGNYLMMASTDAAVAMDLMPIFEVINTSIVRKQEEFVHIPTPALEYGCHKDYLFT